MKVLLSIAAVSSLATVGASEFFSPEVKSDLAYLATVLHEVEDGRRLQDDEQCYQSEFPLLNALLPPPYPPSCMGCEVAGSEECYENPCWCQPPEGSTGCCPDPGERPLYYPFQVSDAFRRFNLSLSEPILFTPAGCDPWPETRELYNETFPLEPCDRFPNMDDEGVVCAFIYPENDSTCGGLDTREYGMQTFPSYDEAIAAGAAVTHFGACGVCSNAHDLAVFLDSRVLYDALRGNCSTFSPPDVARPNVTIKDGGTYQCYKDMGFTDECAYYHASSDIAGRGCTETCDFLLQGEIVPPTVYSCELNPCIQCETDFRGDEYIKWAGRGLLNSGLIAYNQFWHYKYNCSDFFDNPIILQDPYFKANSSETPIPVTPGESADRFQPSYRLLVNPETCFYDFTFTMKHDPTLPIAGGWNPDYPNGVTREEFDELCSPDANVIADDGLPYRERRKFVFNFGDDVKDITGLFDHMSIDFNPCGHQDEVFFGRAHYDMHMYTVSEEWRTIMNCDTTPCNPQDCKFDANFQSTASGKAFFDMELCSEPFPDYILAALAANNVTTVVPGFSNKNMPFGFTTLAHTGVQQSGIHSINLLTALQWDNTQVERWVEPFMFMMSFDNLVTVYEPMVPAEFFQGNESKAFRSPESPPLCQTLMGMPLTYNASYDAVSGFTTFQYLGLSPLCACESGLADAEACALNDAELAKYDTTYMKYTNTSMAPTPTPPYFGRFTIEEVEEAFNLEPGSLIVEGQEGFDCLSGNNFWTDYEGTPLVLNRLVPIVNTTRNMLFQTIGSISTPMFTYFKDRYYEHVLLGCFYRPKSDEIIDLLIENGLEICADLPSSLTGVYVQYHVVGYIDEYTRLLYFGYKDYHKDDVQFMSQFVKSTIRQDYELLDGEAFAYQLTGPNSSIYEGFADAPDINMTSTDLLLNHPHWLGNHGDFIVTVERVNLTEPCPDELCGSIVPGLIPNPAAPDAPWPDKILDNNCTWWYCTTDCGEASANCSTFDNSTQCAVGAQPSPAPDGSGGSETSDAFSGFSKLFALVGSMLVLVLFT